MKGIDSIAEALDYCSEENFAQALFKPMLLGEDKLGRCYWQRPPRDSVHTKQGILLVTERDNDSHLEVPFSILPQDMWAQRLLVWTQLFMVVGSLLLCSIAIVLSSNHPSKVFWNEFEPLCVMGFGMTLYWYIGKALPKPLKSDLVKTTPIQMNKSPLISETGWQYLLNLFWYRCWGTIWWRYVVLPAASISYVGFISRGPTHFLTSVGLILIPCLPYALPLLWVLRVRQKLQAACKSTIRVGFISGPKRWKTKQAATSNQDLTTTEKKQISSKLKIWRNSGVFRALKLDLNSNEQK